MSDSGEKFAILRRGGIFIMYITSSRGVVSASPHFLWFRLGEGYGSKGTLFWMPVANQNSTIPDPKTWVEHNDRRLDLHLISDMYARKQTAAFKSPAASNAINECCLSLASAKTGKELNIECQSKQQRDQLFHEVYALITNEKSIEHFTSGSKRPSTAQTTSSSSSSSSSQSRPATASVSSSSSSSHSHSKSSEMRPATAASPQQGAQRAPVQLQSSSSAHALNRPPSQNSGGSSPSSSPRVSSPPNGQGMPPLSSSSSSSSASRSTPPAQLPPFPQILEILAKGTEFYLYALDPKRNVVRVRAFLFVKDGKGYGPSGTLFWGPLNSYTESNAYRLPLHTITEMSLRKQSAILRSSAASHAPEERCFALASPHIQINLEAHTSLVRDLWWKGILHKLQQTGKEILRTSLVPEQTEPSTKPVLKGNGSKDGETGPYGTLIHHPQQQSSSSSSSSSSNGKNIASKQPSSSPVSSAAAAKPQHQDKSPRMDQTLLSLSDGHFFRKHDMEGAGLKHRVTNIILWTQGQGRHGTLYWAEGDKKVISPNKQLPLQSITDVLFRKQTPALLHCNAPDSYCFALVSDKMTLSLEADSADKCKSWLDGLARILTMAGKTVELQQSQGEKPVSAAQAAAQIKSGASVAQDKRPASAAKAPSAHDEISRTAQPHQQVQPPTKLHTSPSEPTISRTDPTERFLLQLKLGEGSYGSVFRALDREDGKAVAIKVLQMDGSISGGLQREIQILQQCNSPYIVGYKGAFQKNDSVWIVMEYCAAGALTDIMKVIDRPLNEAEVATVVKMALHGLAYLHSVGKIHRDIKAGNILANHEGFCKLADFGVSGELNNTIGKQRTVIGTPHWMAPEVLTSDDYDEKADIWSLGITAYELAIGDPPHANLHSLRAAIKIPASPPPTLPDPHRWTNDFHSFIAACLVKDFTKRASAQQLLKHPFITKALPHTSLVELCHTSMEASEQKAEDFDPSEVLRNGNQPQRADVVSSTVRHPVSNNNIESTFEISEPQERDGSGTVVFGTIDSRDDSKISDTTLDFGTMMYKPAKAPEKKKDNYMASNDDRKADKGAKPSSSSSSKSRSKHDDPEYESKPVKSKHKHKSKPRRGDRDSSDDEYEQDFDDSPGNVKPDKKNPKNGKQASEGHYTFQISDFDHLAQK